MAQKKYVFIGKETGTIQFITAGCERCDTCNETAEDINAVYLAKLLFSYKNASIVNEKETSVLIRLSE